MLKRYLLVIEKGEGYMAEETVEMYVSENTAKSVIGQIVGSGQLDHQKASLKSVYEVDLSNKKIKRLDPLLVNMEIVLKEVK